MYGFEFPYSEQTCGNCAHWDIDHETITYTFRKGEGMVQVTVYPCLKDAVEPDAGHGAVVLRGKHSNCQQHAGEWEPCEEYLARRADDEVYYANPAVYNGVRPGIDCPAFM